MALHFGVLAGVLLAFHASEAINTDSSLKAMEWQNAEKALKRSENANANAAKPKTKPNTKKVVDALESMLGGTGANEAPSQGRSLRAKGTPEASAAIAAESPEKVNVSQMMGEPESAMEKQLTDLMMGGGGAKGTGFTKSVAEISRLIKDDMMVKVQAAHDANQKQLDHENKEIHGCMETRKSQTEIADKKKATYLKTSPLHQTCRAGEAGKLTEKNEVYNEMKDKERIKLLKCKEFAMVEKKYSDQQANGQIAKKAGSEEPEAYVRRLTSTICGELPLKPGKGGGGRGGFLDIFMHAKLECQFARQEWQGLVQKYETVLKEYIEKLASCDSLQDQMDGASCKRAVEMKDACESYAECYMDKTRVHAETVKMVKTEETDRKAEWRGLKRMQCLMTAFSDGKVSNDEVQKCKATSHSTDHLTIKWPVTPALVTCSVPNLYPSTPQYKLKEFAVLPALARGKEEANECTGVIEINTKPSILPANRPERCKCERVTLNGPYSAGPLVKCTGCKSVRRSEEKNSCPEGTKLFSPASAEDWKAVLQSVGDADVRAPNFIVDVTRKSHTPQADWPASHTGVECCKNKKDCDASSGGSYKSFNACQKECASQTSCLGIEYGNKRSDDKSRCRGVDDCKCYLVSGGCPIQKEHLGYSVYLKPLALSMNSHTPQGNIWHTSDGSPWFLRSTKYSEPSGDGQPNCYMDVNFNNLGSTDEHNITFNDKGCQAHSESYYCQKKGGNYKPKQGSPASCSCKPIVLTGSYSAGELIRCSKCLDVSKSLQKNSCPVGTKIFSPANAKDWKTFLGSAKPLRSPNWIVDVTRPQNGCGGCTKKPMNSKSPAQMTWRTADGSPWWLRSSLYSEPSGDYHANCYMDLYKTPFSETSIMFNDKNCEYHADSYYCQPVKKHAEDYEEHQASDEEQIERAEEHQDDEEGLSEEELKTRKKIKDAQEPSPDDDPAEESKDD